MKSTMRIFAGALGAFLLATAGARAAEPPPPLAAPTLAASDKLTLQKLHDGNQTQSQMGKLAQDKGSTRAVRDFGRRLANDATVAERKIDEYLRTRGTDLTALATTTSADSDHELLATKVGLDFDRLFAQQISSDLQDTVDLLGSARVETADDTLRLLYDELSRTVNADKKAADDLLTGMTRS
jgi:predicted outer membrane protein